MTTSLTFDESLPTSQLTNMGRPPAAHPQAMNLRRLITLILVVTTTTVAVVIASSNSNRSSSAQAPQAPPPPAVTVATIAAQELAEHAEFTARVEATDSVEVRPRISGHIVEVRFQSGQRVAKGDVLFVIDPRWQRAEVARRDAELAQANLRLETATREHDRAQVLLAKKAVANEEAERRTNVLLEARAAVAVAEAAVRTAQLDLAETEVRSPIDGRISRALTTVGNYVSGVPGMTTVMTTIVSIDPVYVYGNIDEATLLKIRKLAAQQRAPLPIELGIGDETDFPRKGVLESFDNRIDSTSGNIVMRATFANADNELIPGLFGRVRVPTSAAKMAVLVPERALGTDQGQRFVFVLGDHDVVEYRAVKLGGAAEGMRIVTEGLHPGDQIVVSGLQRVRPGMAVTPERATVASR
jgi:RND family efflux transporter MFP subunit